MTATLQEQILHLPDDWWKMASTCHTLLKWFRTHTVGLLIAGQVGPKAQHSIFSGFLLGHAGQLLWVTAGHVAEEINTILKSENFELSTMVWLDGFPVEGAENLTAHNRDLTINSWKSEGVDLGIVRIEGLDAENLLANPNMNVLEEQVWTNLKQASPEGYYLIGYPGEWIESDTRPAEGDKQWRSVTAHIACVPLEEVSREVQSSHDFWHHQGAFYGRLVEYPDLPEFELESIVGMSGGPILSIERNSEGQLVYRLVGLQSAWLPADRIIRAAPIHRIAQLIGEWLGNAGEID